MSQLTCQRQGSIRLFTDNVNSPTDNTYFQQRGGVHVKRFESSQCPLAQQLLPPGPELPRLGHFGLRQRPQPPVIGADLFPPVVSHQAPGHSAARPLALIANSKTAKSPRLSS